MRLNTTATAETLKKMEQIAEWLDLPPTRHQNLVIERAVDELYRKLFVRMNAPSCKVCGEQMSLFEMGTVVYIAQCDCDDENIVDVQVGDRVWARKFVWDRWYETQGEVIQTTHDRVNGSSALIRDDYTGQTAWYVCRNEPDGVEQMKLLTPGGDDVRG